MAMKQLIIILSFFCCITSTSLCENGYGSPIESSDPTLTENYKSGYTISATNEVITISSLTAGSQVWVFDASGRNIYNKIVKNDLINVPIRSRGVFIIRIKNDKEIFTTKIFIK